MKQFFLSILIFICVSGSAQLEQWDYFELSLKGPSSGNPFTEVELSATFTNGEESHTVKGFYDGEGVYRIRFMPELLGKWNYQTQSNEKKLNGKKGNFDCVGASGENHGMIRVDKQFHFRYSDGSPYYPFGTTAYAWTHQSDSLQELTLQTLENSSFNKIRMCVFPKKLFWKEAWDPLYFPFKRTGEVSWDFYSFDTDYFKHLEGRILQLQELGIECDLILFHPYDYGRWGISEIGPEESDFYLEYIIARLGAFRNIWWSAANEYDLIKNKDMDDWDHILQLIQKEDPYQHLSSIHDNKIHYDWTKPWVTHVSIQDMTWGTREWIKQYQKPIIVDECRYEGNLKFTWGDLSAEGMTQQFWDAVTRGGYASHGETYLAKIIWWEHGGELHGGSANRIAFLREIIEDIPDNGLTSFNGSPIKWNRRNSVRLADDYFLFYFGERQPIERDIELPEAHKYLIDVIDTWNMSITRLDGEYSGITTVPLAGNPWMAVRAIRVKE